MKLFATALILSGLFFVPGFVVHRPESGPRCLPEAGMARHAAEAAVKPAGPSPQFLKKAHWLIQAAARKHRVPAAFVSSIVRAESNFDPNALSPRGAVGLMQLMPETAQEYGADPHIVEQNIDAGTRYLRWLVDRYHRKSDGLRRAIAAYNAGPAMVDRYRGVPPFRETRVYVARVLVFLKEFENSRED